MVHVMHCEGRGWDFSGNDEFYMHLRGNHAQIRPVGELSVKFHDGDEYVWSTVSFSMDMQLVIYLGRSKAIEVLAALRLPPDTGSSLPVSIAFESGACRQSNLQMCDVLICKHETSAFRLAEVNVSFSVEMTVLSVIESYI